jgi:hypothetical protein
MEVLSVRLKLSATERLHDALDKMLRGPFFLCQCKKARFRPSAFFPISIEMIIHRRRKDGQEGKIGDRSRKRLEAGSTQQSMESGEGPTPDPTRVFHFFQGTEDGLSFLQLVD